MKQAKILIVEDEPKVAASVRAWLEDQQYTVDVAPDGAVGRHLGTSQLYDLVLLDLNLPYVDGYEVCQSIRERYPAVPIIILSARDTVENKLTGFDLGADDYLVKPFDLRELLMRIRAQLKRQSPASDAPEDEVLRVADLEVNTAFKTVRRGEADIELTAKEYALLEYLIRRNGRVSSRAEIAASVWDINFDTGTNVVDVYINFLRRKIDRNYEPKLIHTKQGMGYYLMVL